MDVCSMVHLVTRNPTTGGSTLVVGKVIEVVVVITHKVVTLFTLQVLGTRSHSCDGVRDLHTEVVMV